MNENELLKMMNVILDNIEMAERNNFSNDAIKALYKARDAIIVELKAL